jgi:hypothetical protein
MIVLSMRREAYLLVAKSNPHPSQISSKAALVTVRISFSPALSSSKGPRPISHIVLMMIMNVSTLFIVMDIDDERDHMVRSCGTIFPESSKKTAWDCVGFVFIVIQSISIPFNLCFGTQSKGTFLVIDTVIDCFFLIDICKFQLLKLL